MAFGVQVRVAASWGLRGTSVWLVRRVPAARGRGGGGGVGRVVRQTWWPLGGRGLLWEPAGRKVPAVVVVAVGRCSGRLVGALLQVSSAAVGRSACAGAG